MKKYILGFCLALTISFFAVAQTNDAIAYRKADSVRQVLKTAKGKQLVDCYNMLAECYFWIHDDDIKHYDTACMYRNKALEEAKKINYKTGIAYAKADLNDCTLPFLDKDRNNNDTEPEYILINKNALEVLNLAAELKDDFLGGLVYYHLAWKEKWWGSQDKFKETTQKAIQHFEKITAGQYKDRYKSLMWENCSQCIGTEAMLGWLYLDLSRTETGLTPKRQAYIDKAIYYYTKINDKSGIGDAYRSIANAASQTINLEVSIQYYTKALALYREANYPSSEVSVLNELCGVYWNMGDFESGLNLIRTSLVLAEKIIKSNNPDAGDSARLRQSYFWLGRFYEIAGDYENAFAYFKKGKTYNPANTELPNQFMVAMGELNRKAGNYDSAKVYLLQFEKRDGGKPMLANLYVSLKQYDDALRILTRSQVIQLGENGGLAVGRNYIIIASAYLGKNDLDQALINARDGITYLGKMKRNVYLPDGYKVLSDIFEKLGRSDSALHYFKKFSSLKDSLLNKQFLFRLNDYKKEAEESKRTSQINLLQKDNLIKEQELQQQLLLKEQSEAQLTILDKDNQLKDQKLKEEIFLKEQNESKLALSGKENKQKDERLRQQATIRNALLGGLLLFIILGVFAFRNLSLKRKNDALAIKKQQAELQQKVAELEMQALRAQMNPHFIFNCLNSINRFIFKNETKEASDYLTRFSRLIRMVLLHSQKKLVPLEDELEMLKLYLDMERLRFKNAFDYHITTTNDIENSSVFIPPLLLQPFCENAIWHGLMHKEGPGHLNIELNEDNGILNCIITDDGVGREKAEEYKSKSAEKEKSMGLKITTERLSLLNQGSTGGTFYKIEDVRNEQGDIAGTRVKLQIKYKESIDETFDQNNITAENMSKKR
jgi:hypothetical protein